MRTSIIGWLTGCVLAVGCGSGATPGAATTTTDAGRAEGGLPGSSSGSARPEAGTADGGGVSGIDAAMEAAASQDSSAPETGVPTSTARVVAYLPNYSGSYADWAKKIDFTKMTHLNLAFASATGTNDWDMGAADADVKALVDAAHAAGVKVLASLGGGGGDQTVIARYKDPTQIPALVAKLDAFVAAHGFDGVDVDIEDPANLGAGYTAFVDKTVATLRPEGKLVTAAVAQYLQDSMADATLHTFDFVNVMIYSSYSDSVGAMTYYSGTKSVPATKLTLGAGFFGTDGGGNEYTYADILAADPSAWSKDQAQVNGNTVNYTGVASMKKLAGYSKGFGGIMFWELSQDVSDPQASLYKAIQSTM